MWVCGCAGEYGSILCSYALWENHVIIALLVSDFLIPGNMKCWSNYLNIWVWFFLFGIFFKFFVISSFFFACFAGNWSCNKSWLAASVARPDWVLPTCYAVHYSPPSLDQLLDSFVLVTPSCFPPSFQHLWKLRKRNILFGQWVRKSSSSLCIVKYFSP